MTLLRGTELPLYRGDPSERRQSEPQEDESMMSRTKAGTLAVLSIGLAAVSAAALAQQYSTSDPRSTIYNNEALRREDEIKRNEEAARRQSD